MSKKIITTKRLFWYLLGFITFIISCKNGEPKEKVLAENLATETKANINSTQHLSQKFKDYWYAGEAEISSYQLEQARYGEIRQGNAVLIYVTEDFLPNKQVKADNYNRSNIPVLKLNATKKFNTGIYPYSVMQSSFYPVSNAAHAIKVSSSMQEWCGHVYVQLNNREQFEITSHSYFENEADQHFKMDKAILENELWTQLRIDPKSLPIGDLQIVPAFEFARLRHVPIKPYKANASLKDNSYTINYPDLNRTLAITFNPDFPYDILEWVETFKSGFGANAKMLTSKATKLKTMKLPYWQKNSNADEVLRDTLLLD